jgi:hypothetical protein
MIRLPEIQKLGNSKAWSFRSLDAERFMLKASKVDDSHAAIPRTGASHV